MAFIRKKTNFSKNDTMEKNQILEAFWNKCIKNADQEGIDYLISQLKKYKMDRPSVFHLSIDDKIQQINKNMTCESFIEALQWITPLESKLIDLFENLKIIDRIERGSFKETPVHVSEDDLQIVKEYLDEMKMSVAMTIGNANDQGIHSVQSSNIISSVPFATHSVTKIFTGVLALKMIENQIISESMLHEPIKNMISKEAWSILPIQIQNHLEEHNITLYQLMTHKGGVGDYYHNPGGYRDKLEKNQVTNNSINEVKDFLQFSEIKTFKPDEEHYSNLGITLVGLAIEESFRRAKPDSQLNFDDILYEYILKPARIKRSEFTKNIPPDGKYNQADPVAKDWVGGPAGGYWTKAETLEQFSRWLYKECNNNPTFMALLRKYGQEFYKEDRNVIEHSGTFNSASAFFYLSLNSGNMLNVLSDQQLIAPILMSTIRRNMFCTFESESTEMHVLSTQTKKV